METTLDILEALKSKTGAASDYKLAQILGVTRQSISIYRSGVGSFSDDMCVKVASILEVEPFLILAIVYSERTKSNEVKTAWKSLLERLGSVAAMCLIATGINAFQPAPALASETINTTDDLYIMRNKRRRRKAPQKAKIDLSFLVQNLVGFA